MPANTNLDLMVLVSAIATAEGYFAPGDPLPKRLNNPGDLDYAGQIGAVKAPQRAGFDTLEHGICAALRQIAKRIAEGSSLKELIYVWAPPAENDSASYLAETIRRIRAASGLEIDPEAPLWNYLQLQHIP